jgi:hypothetical protein
MHWIEKYLGVPWKLNPTVPDSHNCWTLACCIQRDEFQRKVPEYQVPDLQDVQKVSAKLMGELKNPNWVEIPKPVDGCMVGLSHSRIIHHVGVFSDVDGGLVVHCLDHSGVVAHNSAQLKRHRYSTVKFYLHKSWLPIS